jgi:Fe-S-cluster-containing dehydrogenase component
MSAKWNLFVDLAKCTGCRNCFIAVKDEYVGNSAPGVFAPQPVSDATWFAVEHHERGQAPFTEVTYLPKSCRHCDDAPCVRAATDGAVEKRLDGIVVIHPEKAKGQRAIVEACPFGAVKWNEELSLPQAWPFDAHLLDAGWKRTRVEQVCPTGALKSEKLGDAARDAKCRAEGWRALPGEEAVRPRILYRGLERLTQRLVVGTVTGEIDGREECLEGAVVRLTLADGSALTSTTDAFGDFRFEVGADAKAARLTIEATGFRAVDTDIEVERSVGTAFRLGARNA